MNDETPTDPTGVADPPKFGVFIRVMQRIYLDAAQIWPDGDAPEEPTVADVIATLKRTTTGPRDVLSKWGDVTIWVNEQRVDW